jgi:hypothetical protein
MAERIRPNLTRVFVILLCLLGAFNHLAFAGSLLISWDPVGDSRVAGYKVKYGTASQTYPTSVDVGVSTSLTLPNLTAGTRYYFAVVAYDTAHVEGAPSPEASGRARQPMSRPPTRRGRGDHLANDKISDQQGSGTTTTYGMSTLDPQRA